MGVLKFLITALFVLCVTFLIGALLIPAEWSISRSIVIHASPKQIYPFVSNFKEWEKWSPWNSSKDATLKYTYEGPAEGVGAKQSWTSEKMGNGWMQFTSADPQTGVAYDLFIDMGRSQSSLHGNISFEPEGDLTRVIWVDQGHSGTNFFKRWMSLMMRPMLGRGFDSGLKSLKSLVEKKVHEKRLG